MKTSNFSILILVMAFIVSSCSGVKVVDSWTGDNVSTIKNKNILVIARTANNQARIAFEQEISAQLRAKGLKATESFKELPHIDPDRKLSEEETKNLAATIKREGYNAVVLSVIKDYQESTQTTTDGGYYAGGTYGGYGWGGLYPGYYGGFGGYYSHPIGYVGTGVYTPMTSSTRIVKDYVLETVTYNLDEPDGKQLIAVVTTKIEDPQSMSKNAKEYSEKIMKALEKKK
ncbi:hypothetical protein [Formosa haliotis]|uniref:hypothetical protein n=1 Tax=Formosa haliotis TaxID=1555194 RepID=UPI00082413A5|nr:hypothetical protein [Formosa haliotis]